MLALCPVLLASEKMVGASAKPPHLRVAVFRMLCIESGSVDLVNTRGGVTAFAASPDFDYFGHLPDNRNRKLAANGSDYVDVAASGSPK